MFLNPSCKIERKFQSGIIRHGKASSLFFRWALFASGNCLSPYHQLCQPLVSCVFDDDFHTVYNDGEGNLITDAICNLLWENDWELYAEDKYGPDGSLIYTQPPLGTVWLDEEGLCERHQQLLDQCRWVRHQTWIKKQAVLIPQINDAPGPAPHHPIISEDTSVSNDDDNPDDASSFDSSILFKPEGDAWVDHGSPNNGPVLDNSASSAPPTSSSSEKKVSWENVVVDKSYSWEGASTPWLCRNPKPSWKKRELQALAHLYVVLSYSQVPVPPTACPLSRKKMKYQQRMAWHAKVGDQFLLSL
jgi:hypothetical protein